MSDLRADGKADFFAARVDEAEDERQPLELIEDVAHVGAETRDVGLEILAQPSGVGFEALEIKRRRIEERISGGAAQPDFRYGVAV